jgi:cell division protein FtsB
VGRFSYFRKSCPKFQKVTLDSPYFGTWVTCSAQNVGEGQVIILRGLRISTFIFSLGLVYFAVHFFVGQQGLLSWRSYVQRADELTLEKQALIERRIMLTQRVARLTPSKVDVDFIEERAFSQLGLLKSGDIAIPMPQESAAPEAAVTPSLQTPNL